MVWAWHVFFSWMGKMGFTTSHMYLAMWTKAGLKDCSAPFKNRQKKTKNWQISYFENRICVGEKKIWVDYFETGSISFILIVTRHVCSLHKLKTFCEVKWISLFYSLNINLSFGVALNENSVITQVSGAAVGSHCVNP